MRILILSPHCDDAEVGCGGTIKRWSEEGHHVRIWIFGLAEKNFPSGVTEEIRTAEVKESMRILGVTDYKIENKPERHRIMSEYRQSILDDMIKERNAFSPDVVFMPCCNDIHQDHATIAKEGMRAFKHNTIYGYEMPWNNITSNHRMFVRLSENNMLDKMNALSAYETVKFGPYLDIDFINSLARVRGAQIGTKYAESFEVIREVI